MAWWRRVIHDYHRLWLFARENKGDYPTEKRDPKKEIEYDNGISVRTFSLDGNDRGKKVNGQNEE
jgi:hypothetical protein